MLFVVWSVKAFLGKNIVLRGQHVELRVLESLLGVFYLGHPIFHRFLHIGLLLEHSSLDLKFPLQLGGLRVQSVVHKHLFPESGILPQANRACTNDRGALEQSHLLVKADFCSNVSKADLPHLEHHWDNKEGLGLSVVLLECLILAEVFILHGVIRSIVESEIVDLLQ